MSKKHSTSATSKIANLNHWYEDFEINQLLEYYFKDAKDTKVFFPVLGTDLGSHNILEENIKEYLKPEYAKDKRDKVIIPVNLSERHWLLVYIFEGNAYYVEPYGGAHMNNNVVNAIKSAGIKNVINADMQLQAKNDTVNCGMYVVEAARYLAKDGALPSSIDIQKTREEHSKKLSIIKFKDGAERTKNELSKLGIFNTRSRAGEKQRLGIYVDEYLAGMNELIKIGIETENADLLLAIKLQNEEIQKFLSFESRYKNVFRK
jgi:hypothetical protein